MSQLLTLELSDDVYAALKQQADAAGLSVAELIVISVVDGQHRLLSVTKLQPEVQSEEAHQRLFSYAGAISLGYATGIDNESIDAKTQFFLSAAVRLCMN